MMVNMAVHGSTSTANNDQLKLDLTIWDHSEKLQTLYVMVVVAVIY